MIAGEGKLRCPLCKSEAHLTGEAAHDLAICRCSGCGVVVSLDPQSGRTPVKDVQVIHEWHPWTSWQSLDYHVHFLTMRRRERERSARRQVAWLRRQSAGPRLLDVGSSYGYFLLAAREAGFHVCGLEPVACIAQYAADKFGLDVRPLSLKEVAFQEGAFDVVTYTDVLEHLSDPVIELEEVRRVLRPGGLLLLTVPNMASRWLDGADAESRYLADHVFHFTPKALTQLVAASGFDIKDWHTVEDYLETVVGLTAALRRKINLPDRLLRRLLRSAGWPVIAVLNRHLAKAGVAQRLEICGQRK